MAYTTVTLVAEYWAQVLFRLMKFVHVSVLDPSKLSIKNTTYYRKVTSFVVQAPGP